MFEQQKLPREDRFRFSNNWKFSCMWTVFAYEKSLSMLGDTKGKGLDIGSGSFVLMAARRLD
jgi:hypothetical protein